MFDSQISMLTDIGFTKLQARIYLILIQNPNITGYKIAKNLNEPVANTYKALQILQERGVVILDESSSTKLYSAQLISTYMNQLERNFRNKRILLEDEMKKIKAPPSQEGIFNIENLDQLYEQTANSIKNAEEILVIDSSPLPLEILSDDLQKIAEQKTKVFIKAYTDIKIPGCEVIYLKEMGSPVYSMPIQYFHMIIPGKEHVSAMLDIENKKIFQAVHCKSKFLTLLAYNGFGAEFILTKLLGKIYSGDEIDKYLILEMWDEYNIYSPGKISATQNFIQSFS